MTQPCHNMPWLSTSKPYKHNNIEFEYPQSRHHHCYNVERYLFSLWYSWIISQFGVKQQSFTYPLFQKEQGQSWSWSNSIYSSIYSYLCNQCLSPLTLWVRFPLRQGVLDTTLCDKVCQWSTSGRWFSPVLGIPPPIKLTATIYLQYCWKWRWTSNL